MWHSHSYIHTCAHLKIFWTILANLIFRDKCHISAVYKIKDIRSMLNARILIKSSWEKRFNVILIEFFVWSWQWRHKFINDLQANRQTNVLWSYPIFKGNLKRTYLSAILKMGSNCMLFISFNYLSSFFLRTIEDTRHEHYISPNFLSITNCSYTSYPWRVIFLCSSTRIQPWVNATSPI